MTPENKAALYYYVLRRFPPATHVIGDDLDRYCSTVLKNETCRTRVLQDMSKTFYNDAPEITYRQLDLQITDQRGKVE